VEGDGDDCKRASKAKNIIMSMFSHKHFRAFTSVIFRFSIHEKKNFEEILFSARWWAFVCNLLFIYSPVIQHESNMLYAKIENGGET
jgi:hypothetical protein